MKPWLLAAIALVGLLNSACSGKKASGRITTVSVPKQASSKANQKRRTATPTAGNVKPQARQEKTDAAAPPAFEALTSAEERLELARQTETSLGRAQRNLAQLRSGRADAGMASDIGRVESFIRQAQSARQSNDLAMASTYARRAELLSEELLQR